MTTTTPTSFEDAIIADMRANGGRVATGRLAGHPLLILTVRGAQSGEPRRVLLTWHRDGDDYVVAGTAGGSPTTPAWVHNLRANPELEIEVDNRTFPARATLIDGPDRDRLWAEHVEQLPWFADYERKTTRRFPMVRITPSERR